MTLTKVPNVMLAEYKMKTYTDVNTLSMVISAGTPAIVTLSAFPAPCWAFSSLSTESIVGAVPPQDDWSNGNIVGFKMCLFPFGSPPPPHDVVFNVTVSTIGDGQTPGIEYSENFTLTISSAAATATTFNKVFASPLAYTSGDALYVKISRIGADVADTFVNDCGLVWFQVAYEK